MSSKHLLLVRIQCWGQDTQLAQWTEQDASIVKVAGSNPALSTRSYRLVDQDTCFSDKQTRVRIPITSPRVVAEIGKQT